MALPHAPGRPDRDGQDVVLDRCPLCGGGEHAVLAAFPELTWVRCSCDLIYKQSETSAPAASEFYGATYFEDGDGHGRSYTRRTRRRVQKSVSQVLDVLNHVEPGPLLDVGCSVGYALQAAKRLGLEPSGADISEHAVRTCRDSGFRAEVGTLDRLPYADDEFQVVVMKHVLEHTPEPRAALAEVRRVLRPGGGVFIAIPHAGYHKAVRRPGEYKFYLPADHGREHFVYYTPATLTRLLEEEGFRVARVHPHLVHRSASWPRRLAEMVFAPARALGEWVATAFALRKEFWLVAVRTE